MLPLMQFILSESDVITFHYCDYQCTKLTLKALQKHKRPVICIKYMARQIMFKFISHLSLFKTEKVWALNWGSVFGRTQTYYPWWSKQGDRIPNVWFHDVIHPDGSPFDPRQTEFINNITTTPTTI